MSHLRQSRKCDRACRTLRHGASHSRETRSRNRALLYSMRQRRATKSQVWHRSNKDYAHCTLSSTTQQRPFYGPLSGTTRVSRYQKNHSPTHHPDHHPIFISFFHLPRSIASSLLKLRARQSFYTTSFHVLWSTSWSGALHLIFHTFLHPISVFFSQHMSIPSQPVLL